MGFITGVINETGVILNVLALNVKITEEFNGISVIGPYHYTKNTTALAEPPATVPTLVGVMLFSTNLVGMVTS